MKNKVILSVMLMFVILLSSVCVFAEDTDNNSTSDSDNNIITTSGIQELENSNQESDKVNSKSNENIQIDNISTNTFGITVDGHILTDVNSDYLYYRPSKTFQFDEYAGDQELKLNDGKFHFDAPLYAISDSFDICSENEYLATVTYYENSDTVEYNVQKIPYIKNENEYVLHDGSYFNNLIDIINDSDEEEVIITLFNNVYLTTPFIWNNTKNLTINGYNGSYLMWEHNYMVNSYQSFSVPSITNGEKSTLSFVNVCLTDSANDSNFIINDGTLTLNDILLSTNSQVNNSSTSEAFLIVNNGNLNIRGYFDTANYSTKTNKRNLVNNKGIILTELAWSDINIYEHDYEADYPNYYIYNEGQVIYQYRSLDNTLIESNSSYEYDVIYKFSSPLEVAPHISGNRVLVNYSYFDSYSEINANNLTIMSTSFYGGNINANNLKIINCESKSHPSFKEDYTYYEHIEEHYNKKDPEVLNLNISNITIINSTFYDTVFENNTIKADNIVLESNIFEFDKEFEKVTTAKIEDHNKVELIFNKLINKNNTLKNFEFIIDDSKSDYQYIIENITPQDNKTNTPQDNKTNTPQDNKKTIKKSFKTNNIQNSKSFKKVLTFNQNEKITLSKLNYIFGFDFRNNNILIYIGDVLVFNGSVGTDLSEVLFNITNNFHGTYQLKVVTNSGNNFIKEINIL